ncbi:hypothetical protein [Ekhidna sp.]|uniref:hypothetical protein n=1 Tax=Ekhidna sp. TaxID=2608089 RepID=UPI0032EE7368
MEANMNLSFSQILELLKNLPGEQKIKISRELEKETIGSKLTELLTASPISLWRDTLENDFEASIFPKYSEIAQIKKEMYEAGAIYASMTDSGSTVFGVFANAIKHPAWKLFKL